MTEADNLVLEHLRYIRARVDVLSEDMREVKDRLGALEERYAGLSRRLDRLDGRVERIETLTHPCRPKRPMSATACAGGSA